MECETGPAVEKHTAAYRCEEYGGYAISPTFSKDDRAAIDQAVVEVGSLHNNPVTTFTGERAWCSITQGEGLDVRSDRAHQTSEVSMHAALPAWRSRIARMAFSELAGYAPDREACFYVGECEPPWAPLAK